MKILKKTYKIIIFKILLLPVFIIIWELCFVLNLFDGQIPSILDVFFVFFNYENILEILTHLLKTLNIFIQCLIIGGVTGYIFGIFMGINKNIKLVFYSFFNALKSIPVTIFIPLAIIVFKLSNFLVPLLSIPVSAIVAVNMADACNNINSNRFSTISLIRIKKYSYFTHIIFFETLEILFSTLRIIVTYIIALEIAFDYFLNLNKGLGFFIYDNYQGDKSHLPKMYAGILVVAVLGIILVKFLDIISNTSINWKKRI